MEIKRLIVANLKCDGCASTIKKRLSKFPGVKKVEVFNEQDLVVIEHEGQIPHTDFAKKLASLGYPEATEENGLLTQLKSYASCVMGRLDKH